MLTGKDEKGSPKFEYQATDSYYIDTSILYRYLNWLNRYVRSHDVKVLQVLSDIHWSGSYGDSTGSTSIDGQGNRNITLSCHNGDDTGFYSALFSKKGENGFVTLNVIQNTSELYEPPQVVSTHTTNAAYGSISASGQC